jgi:hypothetical protein
MTDALWNSLIEAIPSFFAAFGFFVLLAWAIEGFSVPFHGCP